jgi:ABC-type nickel/cobalt efflux system permease component RcnA
MSRVVKAERLVRLWTVGVVLALGLVACRGAARDARWGWHHDHHGADHDHRSANNDHGTDHDHRGVDHDHHGVNHDNDSATEPADGCRVQRVRFGFGGRIRLLRAASRSRPAGRRVARLGA